MDSIINNIYNVIWNMALVWTCLGVGIYFSLRTKFSQLRNIKEMVALLFSGEKSEQGISSFQGFCTALAYIAWAKAISMAEKTTYVNNYMFVTPFLTTILGFVMMGAVPDKATLLGEIIILTGLFMF